MRRTEIDASKNSVKHTAEFVVPRSIPTTFSARTSNAVTLALQAGAAFLQRRRVPANALELDDLQQCCFVAWRCDMLLAGKVDIIVHVNRRSSDGAHADVFSNLLSARRRAAASETQFRVHILSILHPLKFPVSVRSSVVKLVKEQKRPTSQGFGRSGSERGCRRAFARVRGSSTPRES